MDKNINALLREIKSRTKWSEVRIASELGTTQPTVSRILNGQKSCMGQLWKSIEELYIRIFE